MRRLTLIRDKLRKHSPGTALPYREGKKAIEAMRLLARFRHDHFIAAHHDHIVWLQQMVTNQHPLELAPADTGIEKTLSRSVTATLVGPAGKALHSHASCHRQHRFRHPVDVLPGLKAGASTPPDGSAVAPVGPRPFLPALNGGVPRAFLMELA